MAELKALAISGFGGIPADSLQAGLANEPDYLAADMGTVDLGAHYLGSGKTAGATDLDLDLMLSAQQRVQVPLLCGSAGIAGANVHLESVAERMKAVAKMQGYHFNLGLIRSEISAEFVHDCIDAGRTRPMWPGGPLTHEEVDRAVRLVGQMGPEPYQAALRAGASVVLGGRACDTSPFVALPLEKGFDVGLTYHMAKIMECASLCAEPGGRDCLLATLGEDYFLLESQNAARRCTPLSVAAHSLYEQPDPYRMFEPGGMLDTSGCSFEAVDERVTKVSGSRWEPAEQYTVKIEGARRSGYRAFTLAGIRDPGAISHIDEIESQIRSGIAAVYGPQGESYTLRYRIYGRSGILGSYEPCPETVPQEIFLIIDVVAESESLAYAICAQAKQNTMHCGFEGRKCTAGNLAFPFSPEVHNAGPVYEFNVYHLLEVDDPTQLFDVQVSAI